MPTSKKIMLDLEKKTTHIYFMILYPHLKRKGPVKDEKRNTAVEEFS